MKRRHYTPFRLDNELPSLRRNRIVRPIQVVIT